MKIPLQITSLHSHHTLLHTLYGDTHFLPAYGAGCIKQPTFCFIFMNPTAKNLSTHNGRKGLQAPRVGFKQIRKFLYECDLLDEDLFTKTQQHTSSGWSYEFVEQLYENIAKHSVYITNLATCTQSDARPLKDTLFKAYLPFLYQEIEIIKPHHIITFGNQVSSILLSKKIRVSDYLDHRHESLIIGKHSYKVTPAFYPVGIGHRNRDHSRETIQAIKK